MSLLSPILILKYKKKKKGLVECILFGIYFFLSIRTVAIAIAITMAIPVATTYMSMSELDVIGCVAEVGAGELDDADATVADATPCEVKYELLPANVA
jgi:hypothetical protein